MAWNSIPTLIAALLAVNLNWLATPVSGEVDKAMEAFFKRNGKCVPNDENNESFKEMCAFEVWRGAAWAEKERVSTHKLLEVCVLFNGFHSDVGSSCSKTFCFDMKESVTFWVLVIGIPISIIVAIIALCWLCSHFAYYMCCCFIFHIKLPGYLDKDHAQDKNKVAPSTKSTANTAKSTEATTTPADSKPPASEPDKE